MPDTNYLPIISLNRPEPALGHKIILGIEGMIVVIGVLSRSHSRLVVAGVRKEERVHIYGTHVVTPISKKRAREYHVCRRFLPILWLHA